MPVEFNFKMAHFVIYTVLYYIMVMGARRINKFWFLIKFFGVIIFVFLCFWVVSEKDVFIDEFCDCPVCNNDVVVKKNSVWEDLVSEFCVCPNCD